MQLSTIKVSAGRPYHVVVGENLLQLCGGYIRQVSGAKVSAIVTDSNVAPLYAEQVERSLRAEGFQVVRHVIPAGEQSKSLAELGRLYSFLAGSGVTRSDLVVALGGGVVGDLAGFAAATYQRGVAVVQMPTTLLSQVDSSVGGKTAIDLPEGKNLAGAFWQPSLVLCDTATLATLSDEIFADGAGEVIKYGAIQSKELFKRLCDGALKTETADIIAQCVDIKREVVEQDELDQNLRAILNFGHTLGHAIEKESGFAVSHGKAVAIGMVLITEASERRGFTKSGTTQRIRDCLAGYGLPTQSPYPLNILTPHCYGDKKRSGDDITLVFLKEIGAAFLHKVKTRVFESILKMD